jgi:hypothetical protein
VAAVQSDRADVGVVNEGIHKGHARGTRPDGQVVSLNHYSPISTDGSFSSGFLFQISHLVILLMPRQYQH